MISLTKKALKNERNKLVALLQMLAWILYVYAAIGMGAAMGGYLPNNVFLLASMPFALLFAYLIKGIVTRLKTVNASEVIAHNPNNFVLFLRCFSMDDYRILGETGLGPKFEETLVNILSQIGPVIALANPKEKLPPIGANRLYVSNNNWKSEVTKLVEQARVLVLLMFARHSVNPTQDVYGFQWEIQQALSPAVRNKVIFVLPEATKLLEEGFRFGRRKKLQNMRSSSEVFIQISNNLMIDEINKNAKSAQFLFFNSENQLIPMKARRFKKGHAGFSDALQPFFIALGVTPPTTNTIVLEWRFNRFFRPVIITVFFSLMGYCLSLLKE